MYLWLNFFNREIIWNLIFCIWWSRELYLFWKKKFILFSGLHKNFKILGLNFIICVNLIICLFNYLYSWFFDFDYLIFINIKKKSVYYYYWWQEESNIYESHKKKKDKLATSWKRKRSMDCPRKKLREKTLENATALALPFAFWFWFKSWKIKTTERRFFNPE